MNTDSMTSKATFPNESWALTHDHRTNFILQLPGGIDVSGQAYSYSTQVAEFIARRFLLNHDDLIDRKE